MITGGTGFVGKTLLSKLLTSCVEIGQIFLLVRPKSPQTPQMRLKALLDHPIFSPDLINSEMLTKVTAISGDICSENLGISEKDRQTLTENVSVIIHSAATLKFNERLDVALNTNVKGSIRLLELAKECKKLKSFIYVSTAYVNSDKPNCIIDEVFCTRDFNPYTLMDKVGKMTTKELETATPQLLKDMPNSYTFTKKCAEWVMQDHEKELPLSIVRPSIVVGAWRDPFPGWVEGFTGMNGLVAAYGTGAVKVLRSYKDNIIDVICVDFVVNLIICAAWERVNANGTTIYHCGTSMENPLLFRDIVKYSDVIVKYPYKGIVGFPLVLQIPNPVLFYLSDILLHYVPALIADLVAFLLGKKMKAVAFYNKMDQFRDVVQFFILSEFKFNVRNMQCLMKRMNLEDRKVFLLRLDDINWSDLRKPYWLEIKKNVLMDNGEDIEFTRKKLDRITKRIQILSIFAIFGILYICSICVYYK